MKYLESFNLYRLKAAWRLPGPGDGSRELLFNGGRVSVWDDEKFMR